MAKKRRAAGTACVYGRTCLAAFIVETKDTGTKYRVCAVHAADMLFSTQVRESLGGACWAAGRRIEAQHRVTQCSGNLQCAHIVSRRYRALRWDSENAVPLCGGHHTYFTARPAHWEQFCREFGVDWDTLRMRAINDPPMDPVAYLTQIGAQTI